MTVAPESAQTTKLDDFDNTPLFMRSLPEKDSEDVALNALQALAHEGTRTNFKNQGDEYFRGKRTREAAEFYRQAIEAKPTAGPLLEALHLNRASCNLSLENYGKVLQDCSKVLSMNPKAVKAYYRSALALSALGRYTESVDCCDRGLVVESENQAIQLTRQKALSFIEAKERKERDRREQMERERNHSVKLRNALRSRNIISIVDKENVQHNPYSPSFDSPGDANGQEPSMVFPVFFLYPKHAISDIIAEFHEETSFSAHVTSMFPPEGEAPAWDTNGDYTAPNLVVYAMTQTKRLLKVGKKMTLMDVFRASAGKDGVADGLEMKNGCLTFVVVPKGEEEARWVAEFKSTR